VPRAAAQRDLATLVAAGPLLDEDDRAAVLLDECRYRHDRQHPGCPRMTHAREHLGTEPTVWVGNLDVDLDGARLLVQHVGNARDTAGDRLARIGHEGDRDG